jgi:hypothetical protein
MEPEGGATHAGESHVLGVPRSVWRAGALASASVTRRWLTGRRADAVTYELTMCFCAGVIRQPWRDRRTAAQEPGSSGGRVEAPRT